MAISFIGASVPTQGTPPSTATSVSLSVPAGLQANDLILIAVGTRNGSDIVSCSDSSVLAYQNYSTTFAAKVFYKIATGSETGFTLTLSPAAYWEAAVLVYRGTDTSTIFDPSTPTKGVMTNGTFPAITTGNAGTVYIGVIVQNSNSGFTFTGMNERVDAYNTGGLTARVGLGVADATITNAGSSGTFSVTVAASNNPYIVFGISLPVTYSGGTVSNYRQFFQFF